MSTLGISSLRNNSSQSVNGPIPGFMDLPVGLPGIIFAYADRPELLDPEVAAGISQSLVDAIANTKSELFNTFKDRPNSLIGRVIRETDLQNINGLENKWDRIRKIVCDKLLDSRRYIAREQWDGILQGNEVFDLSTLRLEELNSLISPVKDNILVRFVRQIAPYIFGLDTFLGDLEITHNGDSHRIAEGLRNWLKVKENQILFDQIEVDIGNIEIPPEASLLNNPRLLLDCLGNSIQHGNIDAVKEIFRKRNLNDIFSEFNFGHGIEGISAIQSIVFESIYQLLRSDNIMEVFRGLMQLPNFRDIHPETFAIFMQELPFTQNDQVISLFKELITAFPEQSRNYEIDFDLIFSAAVEAAVRGNWDSLRALIDFRPMAMTSERPYYKGPGHTVALNITGIQKLARQAGQYDIVEKLLKIESEFRDLEIEE
ncbi:MAG: hypothetical protein JSS32_09375 [Verrucomicrobia bacterium]|nr:hypothetical protein [Verrucomicrobiota bacterium]